MSEAATERRRLTSELAQAKKDRDLARRQLAFAEQLQHDTTRQAWDVGAGGWELRLRGRIEQV
jgi:hypothetical protein